MASKLQKRVGSRSPPPWQRQSYPPPTSAITAGSAHAPPSPRSESVQAETPIQPVPAPRYLDLAPVKSEKDLFDTRPQSPSVSTTPVPSLTSSTNMYQLGPPPPYSSCYPSQPTSAPSAVTQASQNAYVSPPGSRRESREEIVQEPTKLLPSISEALKLPPFSDHSQQHPNSVLPPPPPFSQVAALAEAAQSANSASPTISRSNVDSHHPSSLSSFSSQHSPHTSKPPDPAGHRFYPHGLTESPRQATYQSQASQAASPIEAQSAQGSSSAPPRQYSSASIPPPAATSYPRSPYPSVATCLPQQQPVQARQPIHPSLEQDHSYPSRRPLHPPSSGFTFPPPQTSGLSYHQQMSLGVQQQHWAANAELEKVEEQRRAAAAAHAKRGSLGGAGYGLTVKRHLDDFDLENSLNEIAEYTSQVMKFSCAYGSEAHKYGRSALPISQLPTSEKVSEMINHSMAVTDALHRLKSTIEGMNIAAAEEQANQQQQIALAKPGLYPSYGADSATHLVYEMHAGQDRGEMPPGGGFAGADPKKPRRGRNAPPGRCHSCNRAETPEWRRGPDGARTLCNACGLHYAKLTRKMGVKPGQSGGSQLRPKDGEDPAA